MLAGYGQQTTLASVSHASDRFLYSIGTLNNGRCAHQRPYEHLLCIIISCNYLFIVVVLFYHCVCCCCVSLCVCLCLVVLRRCACLLCLCGAFDGGLHAMALSSFWESTNVLVYFLSDENPGGGFRDKNFLKGRKHYSLTPTPSQSFFKFDFTKISYMGVNFSKHGLSLNKHMPY